MAGRIKYVLVDADGDVFKDPKTLPTYPATVPVVVQSAALDEDGDLVVVMRYLHEMSNEENAAWINARVHDARRWFAEKRQSAFEVGKRWP